MKSRPKKTTIYQVAKRAGVAISTVSRVLNDSPNVSDETKEKVSRAIRELRFRPQASARMLATRQPQMLAIAVPSFTTPFYNEILKGIKDEMHQYDLDIMIYNTGSVEPEKAVNNFFDRGTADAVIILSIEMTDTLHQQIEGSGIPTVLIGEQHPSYSFIDLDDYKGGYLAGEHLVRQGYRRPGMILPVVSSAASENRRKGFIDALVANGIKPKGEYFITGRNAKHAGFTEEAGFEAAQKIIEMRNEGLMMPDSVFCANDTQAVGAIFGFTQAGMRIPEDIALMGYDNIKLTRYLDLTTVDQAMYEAGQEATQQLLKQLNDPDAPIAQRIIAPELIARSSTRSVEHGD